MNFCWLAVLSFCRQHRYYATANPRTIRQVTWLRPQFQAFLASISSVPRPLPAQASRISRTRQNSSSVLDLHSLGWLEWWWILCITFVIRFELGNWLTQFGWWFPLHSSCYRMQHLCVDNTPLRAIFTKTSTYAIWMNISYSLRGSIITYSPMSFLKTANIYELGFYSFSSISNSSSVLSL